MGMAVLATSRQIDRSTAGQKTTEPRRARAPRAIFALAA
jgi:hypothetical protein